MVHIYIQLDISGSIYCHPVHFYLKSICHCHQYNFAMWHIISVNPVERLIGSALKGVKNGYFLITIIHALFYLTNYKTHVNVFSERHESTQQFYHADCFMFTFWELVTEVNTDSLFQLLWLEL